MQTRWMQKSLFIQANVKSQVIKYMTVQDVRVVKNKQLNVNHESEFRSTNKGKAESESENKGCHTISH